jgi:hypothetical protein
MIQKFEDDGEDLADSDIKQVRGMNVAEAALFLGAERRKVSKGIVKSKYIYLRWIPGTSNDIERLFSACKLILSQLRKNMSVVVLNQYYF